MKKWIYALLGLSILISFPACEEDQFDLEPAGEGVEPFQNLSPANGTELVLNPGTPEGEVKITWQVAEPGVDKPVTYQWQADVRNGDFSAPLLSLASNNEGSATTLTLTQASLDQLLEDNGIAAGGKAELQWRVAATNGEFTRYSSPFFIDIVRFGGEGIKSFSLIAPANNILQEIDPVLDPDGTVEFSWNAAESVSGSTDITYTLHFRNAEGSFEEPIYSLLADGNTSVEVSADEFGDFITDQEVVVWAVEASLDGVSTFSNEHFLRIEFREITTLFLIGEAGNGWGDEDDIAFNNDGPGLFSLIAELNNGAAFKLRQNPGDWSVNWGVDIGGSIVLDQAYQLVPGGDDIVLPGEMGTTTKYQVSVDFTANTITISEFAGPSQLFLVGALGVHGAWDPTASIPFRATDEEGVFQIYTPLEAGNGFKFLEIQDWPGDWGCDPDTDGGIIQEGEEDCTVEESGFYLITVDFNTATVTLDLLVFGIIGDATPTGWDSDTDMTQVNDFDWTITIDLTVGNIKFRANDEWAINYGDNEGDGILDFGGVGNDIPVEEAGNYDVTMSLHPTDGYTYELIKN